MNCCLESEAPYRVLNSVALIIRNKMMQQKCVKEDRQKVQGESARFQVSLDKADGILHSKET